MNLNLVSLSQLKIIRQFLIKLCCTHVHTHQSAHLTAQAAHTSLPHHAEQLRLTWMLMTKETNSCLTVHTHKSRVGSRKGTTALHMEEIKIYQTPTQKIRKKITVKLLINSTVFTVHFCHLANILIQNFKGPSA